MTTVADDLGLALRMADEADALTFGPVRRSGPAHRDEARPDAGDRRRRIGRGVASRPPRGQSARRRRALAKNSAAQPFSWVGNGCSTPSIGTKNFVRGVPVWSTLIALLEDGVPTVGVVSAPALARRWWGRVGRGCIHVVQRHEQAHRGCRASPPWTRPACRSPTSPPAGRSGARGSSSSPMPCGAPVAMATSGSYCLLAEGAVDVVAEPEVKLWDLAPLDIVIREAGGRFTDIDGAPGPHGGSAVGHERPSARRGTRKARPSVIDGREKTREIPDSPASRLPYRHLA